MNRNSKNLLGVMLLLVVLSVAATFYKTVVLQDFEVTGVHIEFPTKNSSTVWFVYNNEEYELELKTSNYSEIVTAIAGELRVSESELNADFLAYVKSAYNEGELVDTEEESRAEELKTSDAIVDTTEEGGAERVEATKTEEFSNTELTKPVIESEI